jgi:hypothetical protein
MTLGRNAPTPSRRNARARFETPMVALTPATMGPLKGLDQIGRVKSDKSDWLPQSERDNMSEGIMKTKIVRSDLTTSAYYTILEGDHLVNLCPDCLWHELTTTTSTTFRSAVDGDHVVECEFCGYGNPASESPE